LKQIKVGEFNYVIVDESRSQHNKEDGVIRSHTQFFFTIQINSLHSFTVLFQRRWWNFL